jgi:hypothetical protein
VWRVTCAGPTANMGPSSTHQSVESGDRQDAAARERAVAALARLERGERDALSGFQEALCRYVAVLRAAGLSRDRALEAVRELVSTPASSERGSTLSAAAREALVELSTQWCADEYARGQ